MGLRNSGVTVLLAGALALLCGGCSLALGGITALDEWRAEREARIARGELGEVALGARLRVRRVDQGVVEGPYEGVRSSPEGDLLLLGGERGTVAVPLAAVAQVQRARKRHPLWPAFALGGVVDLGLAYLLTHWSPAGPMIRF